MLDQMRIILNNKVQFILYISMSYNLKTQKTPYPENRENNRSWEATQQEFDFKNLAVFALKLQAHQPEFSFTL